MFNSKVIKYIIIIQSYPMSSYWIVLMKMYYIWIIMYFRQIISWINTIKFWFILIILLYYKINQRTGRHLQSWPAVIVPSPTPIIPVPVTILVNKLAGDIVAANVARNPPFYSFTLFSTASLPPFINKPDFSRALNIFITSFNSSFENINVVVRGAKPEGRPGFLYSCACC